MMFEQWIAGTILNLLIAVAAYRKRAVTASGAVAGFVVGTVMFVAGPAYWGLLMLFFIGSTLFGRAGEKNYPQLREIHAKGDRRDVWQVIANAGPAAVAAAAIVFGAGSWADRAFVASLAAATADTWSSEIGSRSSKPPVSILTLKPTVPGISGAVTRLGLVAGLAGAVITAVAGAGVVTLAGASASEALIVATMGAVLGAFGTLLDSVLGATVQVQYRRRDGSPTEKPADRSGARHEIERGVRWVNNDVVNLITTASVAVIAVAFSL